MTIQACPRCAYNKLDMPGFEDGRVPETDNLGELVCQRCDLMTIPIEFEEEHAYEAFREETETLWLEATGQLQHKPKTRPPEED